MYSQRITRCYIIRRRHCRKTPCIRRSVCVSSIINAVQHERSVNASYTWLAALPTPMQFPNISPPPPPGSSVLAANTAISPANCSHLCNPANFQKYFHKSSRNFKGEWRSISPQNRQTASLQGERKCRRWSSRSRGNSFGWNRCMTIPLAEDWHAEERDGHLTNRPTP